MLDQLKDQIVVTTINQTPDVVTFLETDSRILHNFKEDKVSRNAVLLLTFSRIILIFPPGLKSYPYFPVYGQNHRFSQIWIRENPCLDIFHAVFNMISVEYRHIYRMIILTMSSLIFRHILYNLLAVAWYEDFLLLTINWPILIIWLSTVSLHWEFKRFWNETFAGFLIQFMRQEL